MNVIKSASYHYIGGTSDKIYNFQIVENGDGTYSVLFQYGRRGCSTLYAGVKTQNPTTLIEAEKVFNTLHKERLKKSYKLTAETSNEFAASTPYQAVTASVEERQTEIFCQLLNEFPESELEYFLKNDDFLAQEKHDGKRITLHATVGEVKGVNRSGLVCGIPETFVNEAKQLLAAVKYDKGLAAFGLVEVPEFIIDGEAIGDFFYAFDIRKLAQGKTLEALPYVERYEILKDVLKDSGKYIILVDSAETELAKQAKLDRIIADRGEGMVFKKKDAPYTSGRPNKGGNQLKYKLYAEATCVVTAIHKTKRSFSVGVREDKTEKLLTVGNVTIPANKEFPKVASFVEIRYLYYYKNGSLYQPFFKCVRDDKTQADTLESLKLKQGQTFFKCVRDDKTAPDTLESLKLKQGQNDDD